MGYYGYEYANCLLLLKIGVNFFTVNTDRIVKQRYCVVELACGNIAMRYFCCVPAVLFMIVQNSLMF